MIYQKVTSLKNGTIKVFYKIQTLKRKILRMILLRKSSLMVKILEKLKKKLL